MHFHIVPFILAILTLLIGTAAVRNPGFIADQYFREGSPDFLRWSDWPLTLPKDQPERIRRRFTIQGRALGVGLLFISLLFFIVTLFAQDPASGR